MTSPAIGGQKDSSGNPQKNESTASKSDDSTTSQIGNAGNAAAGNGEDGGVVPPLTAWWRVFKLATLLMKQGC